MHRSQSPSKRSHPPPHKRSHPHLMWRRQRAESRRQHTRLLSSRLLRLNPPMQRCHQESPPTLLSRPFRPPPRHQTRRPLGATPLRHRRRQRGRRRRRRRHRCEPIQGRRPSSPTRLRVALLPQRPLSILQWRVPVAIRLKRGRRQCQHRRLRRWRPQQLTHPPSSHWNLLS